MKKHIESGTDSNGKYYSDMKSNGTVPMVSQ